jgi:hypothetical protein
MAPAITMALSPTVFASDSDDGGGGDDSDDGGGGDGAENMSDSCELVVWTTVALVMVIALTEPDEDVRRLGNISRSAELLLALENMVWR